MRLATFSSDRGPAVGVVTGPDHDTLVDLGSPALDLEPAWRTDVAAVLRDGPRAREAVEAAAAGAGSEAVRRLTDLTLLAPVARPGKIIGIGLNYRDHAEETGQPIPTTPVVFAKFPTSASGPFAPIPYPALTQRLDYEGELGVVIGSTVHGATPEQAVAAVGGYVTMNDVSARDVQNATSQWTLGKSFDGFAPMGPWLVTPDEVDDPHDLDLAVHVNGELRQHSSTRNLIFGVYELVSRLSQVCTLEPGDVIATGTPAGVGIGFDPERLLSVGDRVSVTIAGIGEISSVVVAP